MKIRIAGAGAGKTTSMAETIIHLYAAMEDHLKIFCITFTNSAAKCVNEKLKAHYGCIPDNIVISTIHSFLYQEFVRPYHYLLYGKQYERISIAELPDQYEYKNSMIRRLESKNVLHQTVIPERAKWVVVKKTKDTKKIREKRSIILNSFRSYCGAICIDEAQDIDKDMYEIIKSLSTLDIPMILMGDPKQDLKGHKYLRKLVEEYPDDVEYSTICHRCPQKHLNLSNLIIPDNEKQHSEKNNGSVVVYFASEKNIAELIDENNFDLKYISKKQGIYDTHTNEEKEDNKEALCEEISIAMRNEHPSISDLTLMRGSYYLAEKLLFNFERCKDKKSAMNQTFSHNPLNDKKAYGRIINLIPEEKEMEKSEVIYVSSIDIIKGQEGKKCLFILTTDLAAYLLGGKSDETVFKNKLYVALTRSTDELTIYVTPEVETKYKKEKIKNFFQNYGCEV